MDITMYATALTVAVCLGVGKLIKSAPMFKKVNNKYIPIILAVVGIVFELVMYGVTKDNVVSGFLSAVVAIGLHQQGKNLFTKFSSPISDDTTEEENNDNIVG